MRRRLFTILSTLSLLNRTALIFSLGFFVALAFLHHRSFHELDTLTIVNEQTTLRGLLSYQGKIHYVYQAKNSRPRPLGWDRYEVPRNASLADIYSDHVRVWQRFGFTRITLAPRGRTPAERIGAPQPGARPTKVIFGYQRLLPWLDPTEAWIIPYWLLLLLAALPCTVILPTLIRSLLRRRLGLCPTCGYDLRATLERCPECGHVPHSKPAEAKPPRIDAVLRQG